MKLKTSSFPKYCFMSQDSNEQINNLKFILRLQISLHFWAPLKSALSFGVSPTSMILAPASNCMIRPDVTIGEIPSSIKVPLLDAKITRIQ